MNQPFPMAEDELEKMLSHLIHDSMYDERGVVQFREYVFLEKSQPSH